MGAANEGLEHRLQASAAQREIRGLAATPLRWCLCSCLCLCGCAGNGYRWVDHTALVLRPSHHQAALAFSFGADAPPRQLPALASRNVAAAIGAAMVPRNDDDPIAKPDNIDFKSGRLFLRVPKSH